MHRLFWLGMPAARIVEQQGGRVKRHQLDKSDKSDTLPWFSYFSHFSRSHRFHRSHPPHLERQQECRRVPVPHFDHFGDSDSVLAGSA
jgi:hypothetical protein